MNDLFSTPAAPLDLLEGLDERQRLAATAPDGAVLVRAGAGTGKTRTLVARIQHLIRGRRVAPWEITAVTFTRKAAREIKSRLSLALGEASAQPVSVGTFHSLSARILRRNAALLDMKQDFQILLEEDVLHVLKETVENCVTFPDDVQGEDRRRAIALQAERAFDYIQNWKSWGLTASMVDDRQRQRRSDEEEEYARIYSLYQASMRLQNRVDFGDLILLVVELFEKYPDVAHVESERVRHLLIDEAQDANPAQVKWARWMSMAHRNVFVVGDEDQSIFSFQGGYPGALLDLTGPDATHLSLTLNRRCTDEILAPAVQLVGWNRRSSQKELQSGRSGAPVELHVSGSEREEATRIASLIKAEMASGTPASQIAVLVRAGWVMPPIEEAMLKAGIPYEIVGGIPLLKRREIQVVMAYIRLACYPHDGRSFDIIHDEPRRGVGNAANAAVLEMVKRRNVPFFDACRQIRTLEGVEISGAMREGLDTLGVHLEHLAMRFEHSGITTSELLEMILSPEGIGYRRYLATKSKGSAKRLDNIKLLERVAKDFPDVLEFIDEITLGHDDEHVDMNKVRISTMHSSKGLEWDVVFCPALEMDITPNKRALEQVVQGSPSDPWNGPQGGGMDEERRLVHVAFTRARRNLHLSCSLTRSFRQAAPSPFLPESGIDPSMSAVSSAPLTRKPGRKDKVTPRAGRKGFSSLASRYD